MGDVCALSVSVTDNRSVCMCVVCEDVPGVVDVWAPNSTRHKQFSLSRLIFIN